MATKRFRSNTGYPVTVWAPDAAGNSQEFRIGADEPFETDDKTVIEALSGSPEIEEVKGSSEKDDKSESKPKADAADKA